MNEDLLQYVWKQRLLSPHKQLATTTGKLISIVDVGEQNHHEGPDFLHARVRIGKVLWSGHIEIDVRSSLWKTHKHAQNPQYKNVILRIVWEDDATSAPSPPILQLKHHISSTFLNLYKEFIQRKGLPCQPLIHSVKKASWEAWLSRLTEERLQVKAMNFLHMVKTAGGNWEQAFWELLAHYMGSTQNVNAFQAVARSLPVSLLYKEKKSLACIESLLLGQAGLLTKPEGTYANSLHNHYIHLAHKYQLQPIQISLKYLRMRPSNFPDIRLAQLAHLVYYTNRLVDIFTTPHVLDTYFDSAAGTATSYWKNNYKLKNGSSKSTHSAMMGNQIRLSIDINVRMVAMYAYALEHKNEQLARYVHARLSELACEKNHIVTFWKSFALPINFTSARQSQALLHLKKSYCTPKRCLSCAVGQQIVEKTSSK